MTGIALTDLQMAIVNAAEWIIIIVIIGVVIFGAKKVPELARSFGRATTEYEKAKIEAKKELQRVKDLGTTTTTATTSTTATNVQDREKLESVANTLGINYSEMSDDELRSAIQAEINKDKNRV
ncbi:MAG: twin-arginine translocase TatA/TatE family subunit [Thermoproteota archaeon]|nr:twin-arginine translocase TatA/TatE family subunit [Thermoproteota archaeon]